MALKFRRGTTAQQSGSLAFGEPYVNTTLGTLVVGGATGDIVLSSTGTGSTGTFGAISGSGLDITGDANIAGNVTVGGKLTIGDATSDTVNVVASLSSSLIPQTTNAFDLGSATKIWRDLYISTGSIKFVEGTSVVGTFNNNTLTSLLAATGSSNVSLNALNSFTSSQLTQNSALATITGSLISTASANVVSVSNLNTFSGSQLTQNSALATITGSLILTASANSVAVSNLNSFSSSQLTQNSALATITGSLISSASNLTQRVAANEAVSGTYARTNSANTFTGTQTITGSLYISQDLVVYGSSSIQNVSASQVNIGTNTIQLNTANPAVRFAGINVIDSGSTGATGSLLWDSTYNRWLYAQPSGSGAPYNSAILINGPENSGSLGSEQTLTVGYVPVAQAGDHIMNSQIKDDGTTVSIPGNLDLTGSIKSGQLNAIATITGSLISTASANTVSITNLNTETASLEGRFLTLQSLTSSNAVRLTNIESTTSSLNTSVSNLNTYTSSFAAASVTLTNKTIAAGSNTISGLTNANLSGTAGITNANLANSSVTVTAGTGLSGGGAVALGSSVTLTNAGVTSNVAGTGVTVSGATGAVTISIGQAVATSSDVRFNSIGVGMAASATAGRIDASGDIVAYSTSDKNFKENITPIPNAIDKIRKISGNTYDWKADMKEFHGFEGNDVGVIAQEIEEVLPQLVTTRETGYKAVKYDKLVALLIEGIKEQQQHIDNLTIQVEELKKQKGL